MRSTAPEGQERSGEEVVQMDEGGPPVTWM